MKVTTAQKEYFSSVYLEPTVSANKTVLIKSIYPVNRQYRYPEIASGRKNPQNILINFPALKFWNESILVV